MVDEQIPLMNRIGTHLDLSLPERRALNFLTQNRRQVAAKTEVVEQGGSCDQVGVLHAGWAMRAKVLPDGRRAILNILLPGDVFCLYGAVVEVADYSVSTITAASITRVPLDQLLRVFREFPRLGAAFGWLAAQEESALMERASSLSQRTAFERLAHLLLELHHRLQRIGMVTADHTFQLPLTQELIADALGISHVHVSRTLRKLRDEGLVELDGTMVRLLNLDGLATAAAFDQLYLHQRGISTSALTRFVPQA